MLHGQPEPFYVRPVRTALHAIEQWTMWTGNVKAHHTTAAVHPTHEWCATEPGSAAQSTTGRIAQYSTALHWHWCGPLQQCVERSVGLAHCALSSGRLRHPCDPPGKMRSIAEATCSSGTCVAKMSSPQSIRACECATATRSRWRAHAAAQSVGAGWAERRTERRPTHHADAQCELNELRPPQRDTRARDRAVVPACADGADPPLRLEPGALPPA